MKKRNLPLLVLTVSCLPMLAGCASNLKVVPAGEKEVQAVPMELKGAVESEAVNDYSERARSFLQKVQDYLAAYPAEPTP